MNQLALGLLLLCQFMSIQILDAQHLFTGIAEVNITPPVGYPHYRGISTGIHDSLYAKAIYFRQDSVEMVIVECDLLWISRDLSTGVRMKVQDQTDIPYQNIIIAGTHTHTSPAYDGDQLELNEHRRNSGYKQIQVGGQQYHNWLQGRIVDAVLQSSKKSIPSTLKFGEAFVPDISFNRRYLMNNGKVKTNPGAMNPAAIHPTGPIDPEVGLLMFMDANDNKLGSLLNFALHTDTKGGTEFSADFPGYVSQDLKRFFGQDFISVYGQGACGNINHYNTTANKQLTSKEIGNRLATVLKRNVDNLKPITAPSIKAKSEIAYAKLQGFTPKELAWAMNRNAKPLYDESEFFNRRRPMKIRSLQRIREKEAIPPTVPSGIWHIPLEIQVFRISRDLAIVGLPGEVFVELGLDIKETSPFPSTIVIELTNSHIAYVPTREEFPKGGYETINSRLAPGGGELMVQTALKLLNELYDDPNDDKR